MLTREELLELAESYDETASYLSIFSDPSSRMNGSLLDRRASDISKALRKRRDLRGSFEENLERATELLKGRSAPTAVFVSVVNGFERVFELGASAGTSMVVDSSPYILPLLTYNEEYETYIVVYIDENHARLSIVEGEMISGRRELSESIFHHNKKGGWSQMRYQRNREIALKHFFKEIEETLSEMVGSTHVRRIIVTGPGISREVFTASLPQDLGRRVIGTFPVSGNASDSEVIDRATEMFFETERLEEQEAVEALVSAILKGDSAVYGIQETYSATEAGRSDLVLVSMGLRVPGWKCERDRTISFDTSACPNCGSECLNIDLVEELVEKAVEMRTSLEFVKDSPELDELGGVGAFLRY